VQAINVGDSQFIDAINHARMTRSNGVEPTAAPRAAGGRAKLTTHCVEHIGDFGIFGREWSFAHSGCVGFHNAEDTVHSVRRDPRTSASTARCRVGGSDKRISPMVDVQECTLCAFEQNIGPASDSVMKQNDSVGYKTFEVTPSGTIVCVDLFERKLRRTK